MNGKNEKNHITWEYGVNIKGRGIADRKSRKKNSKNTGHVQKT